ncbi:MAG: alkaline phosphatase [Bacteroidales bacterium]|nr:alkaline phosphatase [Bacteroidales bacterium]
MKHYLKTLSIGLAAGSLLLASCSNHSGKESRQPLGQYNTPKYIFYFVGDGMSQPQISMAEKAISEPAFCSQFNAQTNGIYNHKGGQLNLRKFQDIGMATTNAENRFITCSAAAATALATGHKTTINTISMNGDRTENLVTVAELAKKAGMKVGVISSVSIDHATPACFYAHTDDRSNYEAIGRCLLGSGFDFFGGGFVRWDTYKDMKKDDFIDSLKSLGYTVATSRKDFDALNANSGKVLATVPKVVASMVDASTLPYNIDLDEQASDDDRIVLRDFVRKAIDLLYNEDKGFFLFTEGGKIDWTDHANDAVSNVYETIALDEAIGVAMEFYNQHPDETLIVFTGDHECGGLTLGFAGTHYESAFNLMVNQSRSFEVFANDMRAFVKDHSFNEVLAMLKDNFGLGADGPLALSDYEVKRLKEAYQLSRDEKSADLSSEEKDLFYGGYEPVTVTATTILDNKAGVEWASFSHTALPVPVYSMGQGSSLLSGYIDNTDIPKAIIKAAGW